MEADKIHYLEFHGYTLGTLEAEEAWAKKCAMMERLGQGKVQTHLISTDLAPYKSMVTGEMIEGKKAHREHLRRHNLIEVGNDTSYLKPKQTKDDGLKETIARQVYEKLRY